MNDPTAHTPRPSTGNLTQATRATRPTREDAGGRASLDLRNRTAPGRCTVVAGRADWEGSEEATMTSSGAEHPATPIHTPRRPSLEEQARQRGTSPIESADSYAADGIFESDGEVDEFVAFTYAARRTETA